MYKDTTIIALELNILTNLFYVLSMASKPYIFDLCGVLFDLVYLPENNKRISMLG